MEIENEPSNEAAAVGANAVGVDFHAPRMTDERRSMQSHSRRRFWFAVVTTGVLSFFLGFCCGDRIQTRREVEQEWQRIFSILQWGLREGKVDEDWITELRIIKHESEWDD